MTPQQCCRQPTCYKTDNYKLHELSCLVGVRGQITYVVLSGCPNDIWAVYILAKDVEPLGGPAPPQQMKQVCT